MSHKNSVRQKKMLKIEKRDKTAKRDIARINNNHEPEIEPQRSPERNIPMQPSEIPVPERDVHSKRE